MYKKTKRHGIFVKICEGTIIASSALLTLISLLFVFYLYSSPSYENWKTRKIFIGKGTPFSSIVESLYYNRIITSRTFFSLLAQVTLTTKEIKAGEYLFPAPQKPLSVLRKLTQGDVTRYYITIPEGSNIFDIATILSSYGITDGKRFIKIASSKEVAKRYGFDSRSLEGYLFPDTYVFTKGMEPDSVISLMVSRFKQMFTDQMEEERKKLGITLDQLITIASIVEKETSLETEKALIASIIFRRLEKKMRLQMDPTVIYGLKKWEGKLTRKDLKLFSEFNTYIIRGLPPGPISNPGATTIRASLYPAKTKYLYFVSKNDGTHHFSRSLRDHINAVNRYQKRRSRGRGKK